MIIATAPPSMRTPRIMHITLTAIVVEFAFFFLSFSFFAIPFTPFLSFFIELIVSHFFMDYKSILLFFSKLSGGRGDLDLAVVLCAGISRFVVAVRARDLLFPLDLEQSHALGRPRRLFRNKF